MLIDIPEKYFAKRRGLALLLNFIDGLTFMCQYQSEMEYEADEYGEAQLITHPAHIQWAFKLNREILFSKCDELKTSLREFLDKIKFWLKENEQQSFFSQDIRKTFRMEPWVVKRYIRSLLGYGYIKMVSSVKNKREYVIDDYMSSEKIYKELDSHIEKVMQKVWTMHGERKQVVKKAS